MFGVLPKAAGRLYTLFIVLISWVFFSVEGAGKIVDYLKAMFGLQSGGLYTREAIFMGLENVVLFAIAVIAATPFAKNLCNRLAQSKTGHSIAIYRVLEKLIPAILLLASIAYIVDATYNPFLYFRF